MINIIFHNFKIVHGLSCPVVQSLLYKSELDDWTRQAMRYQAMPEVHDPRDLWHITVSESDVSGETIYLMLREYLFHAERVSIMSGGISCKITIFSL